MYKKGIKRERENLSSKPKKIMLPIQTCNMGQEIESVMADLGVGFTWELGSVLKNRDFPTDFFY